MIRFRTVNDPIFSGLKRRGNWFICLLRSRRWPARPAPLMGRSYLRVLAFMAMQLSMRQPGTKSASSRLLVRDSNASPRPSAEGRFQLHETITERLVLSANTVEHHVANIMDKLQLDNRAHLVRFAIQHGLVSLES